MTKELSWQDAVETVLRGSGGAMHYADIAEQVIAQGLRKSVGATPAQTVATILSVSIKGGDGPFVRLGEGKYTLRANLDRPSAGSSPAGAVDDDASDIGGLRAFGMFWRRDAVMWSGMQPRLLGRQGLGASNVDFSGQVGVYLLHDRVRVVYVGRASDTLASRLKAHNTDRLGGRWDRFSWFGLRGVSDDGALGPPTAVWTHLVALETLEAVLIESLEAPLNRRRGDNLSGVEYIQVEDPEIERDRRRRLLGDLGKNL